VPRQDDHRLADGDDDHDRDVLSDVLPVRRLEEVLGAEAEEDHHRDEREHDPDLAQAERSCGELLRLHRPDVRDHAASSTPAAAWITFSCVASARESSATSLPSRMTR